MGSVQRGALRVLLLGAIASACSGGGSPASHDSGQGGASQAMVGGSTSSAGVAAGASGSLTSMASGGSAGAAAGPVPDPTGMAGEPPLVLNPVATWGGKPLDMVPYAISGTRLSAVGYADDGAVFFDTMRDTLLGTDCTFEQNEAGDWLCSPTNQQSLIYLDAGCTEAAVEEAPYSSLTGGVFGLSSPRSLTGGSDTVLVVGHSPVYRIADKVFESKGTAFAEDSMSLYTGTPQQCVGPRIANWHVILTPPSIYRVTPLADSELVKATVRHVPLNDGLSLERLVTDDGAQLSGHLLFAGKECELQRDGRCVTAPVAYANQYVDADCTEPAFNLQKGAKPGVAVYGVEAGSNEVGKVYELSPLSTVYTQTTRIDMVMKDGQTVPVSVIDGCTGRDLSSSTMVYYYRRTREVSAQMPKLSTVQLGSGNLSPTWFFGLLSGTDKRIQVQIHSPEGSWVRPNIRTKNGSVCAVYDSSLKDECVMMDGLSYLPVTEVNL